MSSHLASFRAAAPLDLARPADPPRLLAEILRRRLLGNEAGGRIEISAAGGGWLPITFRVVIGLWPEVEVDMLAPGAPAEGGPGGWNESEAASLASACGAATEAARRGIDADGLDAHLRTALEEDPWLALTPPHAPAGFTPPGADAEILRSARARCEPCAGIGQIPAPTDHSGGEGQAGGAVVCGACRGDGARRYLVRARCRIGGGVGASPLTDAPEGADAVLNRALPDLLARRGFTPSLSDLRIEGGARIALFTAQLPVALCRVAIGRRAARRVFDVWALGEPMDFVDPPPLLDRTHDVALDSLFISPEAGPGPLADQLAESRIGRAALRAAAAFEPRFDADDIAFADAASAESDGAAARTMSAAQLISGNLSERLFRFAQSCYRSLGHRMRRRIWSGVMIGAPLLAMIVTALGYVGSIDQIMTELRDYSSTKTIQTLTLLAWAIPFLLLWALGLWASLLDYHRRTRRVMGRVLGAGLRDVLRVSRDSWSGPWTALAIGAMFYALAFVGAAPPDQDRSGLAEETQLLGRFRIPVLNSVFDVAADGRDWIGARLGVTTPAARVDLDELRRREVSRSSLLAARLEPIAAAARPDRWAVFDKVAAVKALGPSGVAMFGVLCGQGRPLFTLLADPMGELNRVSLFVNRIALPEAVARKRDGALSWPASDGAISAVRRGVAMRAVVEDVNGGGAVRLYDVTLSDSSAQVSEVLQHCHS